MARAFAERRGRIFFTKRGNPNPNPNPTPNPNPNPNHNPSPSPNPSTNPKQLCQNIGATG